jgi:Tol biopolymer transport system component
VKKISSLALLLLWPMIVSAQRVPDTIHDPAAKTVAVNETGDTLPLTPDRLLKFNEDQGTWVSLDVSPDGKTIVFELLGDLYEMPIQGGEAHCIVCGLPFDSQPSFSPDGRMLAFVSDRSGNENLWVSNGDGTGPRQISKMTDNSVFISPAWSADGQSIFITRYKPDLNAFEIWRYPLDGSKVEQVTHAKSGPDTPKEFRLNAMGAAPTPDGRYLYYESKTGYGFEDDETFPLWHITRRDLKTGTSDIVVTAQGSAFRPAISPNGKLLVYATRFHGKTGLRIRNLETDADSWLLYPIQRDDQEGMQSRDLIPRYAFTPDSASLLLNYGGKIHRVNLNTRRVTTIPFLVHVKLPLGPYLRREIPQESGPVRARLMQWPAQSPDGKRIVFSSLAHLYMANLQDKKPVRLTKSDAPEFEPSWSPDGNSIVYVTWTPAGGDIWRINADGSGQPKRLTDHSDCYMFPVFSPDGKWIYAIRTNNYEHVHRIMDFAPYQADAIRIPVDGGPATVIASGLLRASEPQFTTEKNVVYLNFSDGLYRVAIDGSSKTRVLHIVGPTYYFMEGTAPADVIKISPDGKWALAQITQQLYLLQIPESGKELTVELGTPSQYETRLTSVGADFFDWADGGKTITWALGSTFFRQSLASVKLGNWQPPPEPDEKRANAQYFPVVVEAPRDTPHGTVVLRGATAITMRGNEVIPDADLVIVNDHIAAIGHRGNVEIPAGATIRDVSGKYIIPGFIDVHLHWGSIRRGLLDLQSWDFLATLAYGVTSALDPSSLSIDTFAYQDLVESGAMVGPRIYTTGPALFSFNNIWSEQQAVNVVSRNPDFYRTWNLKEYRTGNRSQREWILMASQKLQMLTTTEGAVDMKLDMTQIQDGFPGNEHAYSAVPIYDDIVQLFARSGVSYTPTLQITNGGLPGEEYFYATESPHNDPKARHFIPGYFLDHKTERMHWALPGEYSFPEVAAGAAKIQRAGGLVAVGSHGQLPGPGYHFELQAMAMGGMTPREILRAATIGSAKTIGRDGELGSLEPGKYADLLILGKNPLADIHNTLSIEYVMKNGTLYEGGTLNEVWPRHRALPPLWFAHENDAIPQFDHETSSNSR